MKSVAARVVRCRANFLARPRRHLVFAAAGVLIGAICSIAFWHWWWGTAAFSIVARSEIAILKTLEHAPPDWFVSKSKMWIDDEPAGDFTGTVEIHPCTEIRFERSQHGQMRISIARVTSGQTPGTGTKAPCSQSNASASGGEIVTLYPDSDDRRYTVRTRMQIQVPRPRRKGPAIVLPLAGHLQIGEIAFSRVQQTAPLLLDGRVTILARAVWTKELFGAGNADLLPGDEVSAQGIDLAGYGLIRVDDGPGLSVVYNATAESILVSRLGGVGYRIEPLWVTRILGDKVVQVLAAVLGTVIALLGIGGVSPTRGSDD